MSAPLTFIIKNNYGLSERLVELYEGAKEILAGAGFDRIAPVRSVAGFRGRKRPGAIYLYTVLIKIHCMGSLQWMERTLR